MNNLNESKPTTRAAVPAWWHTCAILFCEDGFRKYTGKQQEKQC